MSSIPDERATKRTRLLLEALGDIKKRRGERYRSAESRNVEPTVHQTGANAASKSCMGGDGNSMQGSPGCSLSLSL